ncbi:hypothetical protein DBV08_05670 [Rhodococcus sp. KBW08]|uniref:hypothetical protein n=1 Tax=Rhodococcus sp. KBW08 TaxID=2144188 RepID=UPI000F590DAE|nr:hypothetical protein [Rhodococcus sp. KBW08]RQO50008.1 hypothetical protein DBV08_05670 [Rhodococcus sp. KBW08]
MTETKAVPTQELAAAVQTSVESFRASLASYEQSIAVLRASISMSMSSIETSLTVAGHRWAMLSELASESPEQWRETQTSPELIEASWRERRQHSTGAARKHARDHRALYAQRLSELADRNLTRAVADMLTELSEVHGVTWSDIASALAISVPALRKWRKSTSGTTPENHRKLAQLTAFYALLAEQVGSPARWMSMALVDGYNVTPADVYSPDNAERLLDLAAGNVGTTAEDVLDIVAEGWRDRWRSEYEVFEAADGELSMRPRQMTR